MGGKEGTAPMSAPTKFLFDVDFAADGKRTPTEPMMTLAAHEVKLAETETAAHRRGYAEAKAEAATEAERRIADAMERIAAGVREAHQALEAIEVRLECEAVEVAVAVARKLAPALIAREPFAEVSALATDCFRELRATPHIVVRVNDALYGTAREKLDALARAAGYEGRLVVMAEPGIAFGDCRIEWADGGVNRDGAAAEAAIGEAVARYVGARRHAAGEKRVAEEVLQ
jgi:flagellar assembly protein FliH